MADLPAGLRPAAMNPRPRSKSMALFDRGTGKRLTILGVLLSLALTLAWLLMIWMPGRSYAGPLPPLDAEALALEQSLLQDIQTLSASPRSSPAALETAAEYIEQRFAAVGLTSQRQTYKIEADPARGPADLYSNIIVEIPGREQPDQIIVVGAHYDSAYTTPGANDNASGIAVLLALGQKFAPGDAGLRPARTLRLVAFANEEPPFFQTERMGSLVYARQVRAQGDKIMAMLSLETLGYYSDQPGSQRYPAPLSWFYPSTGNFVAFIGNLASRKLCAPVCMIFAIASPFPAKERPCPVACLGWAGPITGASGRWAIPPSWSPIRQPIAIPITTPMMTSLSLWMAIAWRGSRRAWAS